MSIPLTGSGGLFTRLGHLIGGLDAATNYQGTVLAGRTGTIQADYAASNEDLIDNLYRQLGSAQSSARGYATNLRSLAQATVTAMVNDFLPLQNPNYQTALAYLINTYLPSVSATVQRNTVGASIAYGGSNTGNGVVLVSTHSSLGLPLEYLFAEAITGAVTKDAQSGSAVAGQESIGFTGQFAVNDMLSWLYPSGSGASTTLTAVNAGANNGRGTANQLNNGSFESYLTLANVPDKWHVGIGTPGTTILQSSAQHYDGLSSLNFAGNGTENTSVQTQFGVDFNTSVGAVPLAQYAVNLWMKVDSVPGAGVISVELCDGSGTQLVDAQGNASAFTVALTGLSTSWTPAGGFLRTPRLLPSNGVYLRLRLSTALSASRNLFMDRCSLSTPGPFYPGGPYLAALSGSINWIAGDSFTVTTTNARNGLMTSGADRLLGLRTSGLILPSVASSPSISEALVT